MFLCLPLIVIHNILGAGDGKVTQIMAGHFEQVYVTEASTPMKWRLQDLGYKWVYPNPLPLP